MTIALRFRIARGEFALDIHLDMPGRGVTAVLGPSGAGKSTLLRAIAGLEPLREGYLRINDDVWLDTENGILVPPHQRAVGYVFQEANLLPHLNVRRNIEFGWKRASASQREVDLKKTLTLLGIEHLLLRMPSQLSGGERQRVAIARALLSNPTLLLMDEPLSSLDNARRQEILPYLERIHEQLAIPMIYVTHHADEVARLADQVILLDAGKMLANGPVAQVSARLDFPIAFDDDAGVVIESEVVSYDAHYGLASLRVGNDSASLLQVVHPPLPTGAKVRIRILARDVSIALVPQQHSSILDQLQAQFQAQIQAVAPVHPSLPNAAYVVLRLEAAGMPLLARITRQSYERLELFAGKQVWVQFKGSAVFASGLPG